MPDEQATLNEMLKDRQTTTLNDGLIHQFTELAKTLSFTPNKKGSTPVAFEGVFKNHALPVLNRLKGGTLLRGQFDALIAGALNKDNHNAANTESGVALRLRFQACLDKKPVVDDPSTQVTGLVKGFMTHEAAGYENNVPVHLAFTYADDGVRAKFERLFHNPHAPFPFIEINGRSLFTEPSPVAVESHYNLRDTCWLEFTNKASAQYDPENRRQLITDPALIEKAKQFCLHLMLAERLITPALAAEAGYDRASEGACAAFDPIKEIPKNYQFGGGLGGGSARNR